MAAGTRRAGIRTTQPVVKSPRTEQTRAQTLDAALVVLAEQGFEGLRTRKVAEVAHLNHASLHYHFSTKEALVDALVERVLSRFAEIHLGDNRSEPPFVRLTFHLDSVLAHMRREPGLFRALLELQLRSRRDRHLDKLMKRTHLAWRAHLLEVFADAESKGQLRGASVEGSADLVMAFLHGAALDLNPKRSQHSATLLARLLIGATSGGAQQ